MHNVYLSISSSVHEIRMFPSTVTMDFYVRFLFSNVATLYFIEMLRMDENIVSSYNRRVGSNVVTSDLDVETS